MTQRWDSPKYGTAPSNLPSSPVPPHKKWAQRAHFSIRNKSRVGALSSHSLAFLSRLIRLDGIHFCVCFSHAILLHPSSFSPSLPSFSLKATTRFVDKNWCHRCRQNLFTCNFSYVIIISLDFVISFQLPSKAVRACVCACFFLFQLSLIVPLFYLEFYVQITLVWWSDQWWVCCWCMQKRERVCEESEGTYESKLLWHEEGKVLHVVVNCVILCVSLFTICILFLSSSKPQTQSEYLHGYVACAFFVSAFVSSLHFYNSQYGND